MARKLNTNVHVVETDKDGKVVVGGQSGTFRPGDDLPEWAEKSITNEDVFEEEKTESKASFKPAGK